MVRVMHVVTTAALVVVTLTQKLVRHHKIELEKIIMRHFISVCQILFIAISISMLAGCSYITSVSNKNPDIQTTPKGLKAAEPKTSCQNWCHNGWCSTHCETT